MFNLQWEDVQLENELHERPFISSHHPSAVHPTYHQAVKTLLLPSVRCCLTGLRSPRGFWRRSAA